MSTQTTSQKPKEEPDTAAESDAPRERTGPRVVYDELTGHSVVTARPCAKKVTSEEVRAWLEDFP